MIGSSLHHFSLCLCCLSQFHNAFAGSCGRRSRAISLTESGTFESLRHPLCLSFPAGWSLNIRNRVLLHCVRLHYRRLLVQHLVPDRSEFLVQSDGRCPDAMGRSRYHHFCPLMDFIRHSPDTASDSIWTSSNVVCASPTLATAPRAIVHGNLAWSPASLHYIDTFVPHRFTSCFEGLQSLHGQIMILFHQNFWFCALGCRSISLRVLFFHTCLV
jgi:hypothetical protein